MSAEVFGRAVDADSLLAHIRSKIAFKFKTQKAFAQQAGVSSSFVSSILNGNKPVPDWMLEQCGIVRIVSYRWAGE